MSISLRGHSAKDVLELLAETERRFAGSRSCLAAPQPFRKIGNWLVHEKYLDQLIFHPHSWRMGQRLPGLAIQPTLKGMPALLWRRCFAPRICGPCCAQALRVKTNVRAFYLGDYRHSTKAFLEGSGRSVHALVNEVQTRLKLWAWRSVNIPELFSSDLEGQPACLREEIIWGRRCQKTDAQAICAGLLPQLGHTYQKYGVIGRPIAEVVDASWLISRLSSAMACVPWSSNWISQPMFLAEVARRLAAGGYAPCSLGHGDLSLSNLLLTPTQQIYVIDWELARERPILFDLRRMIRSVPDTKAAMQTILREIFPQAQSSAMLGFDQQLFLGTLAAIAEKWDARRPAQTGDRQQANLSASLVEEFEEANAVLSREPSGVG